MTSRLFFHLSASARDFSVSRLLSLAGLCPGGNLMSPCSSPQGGRVKVGVVGPKGDQSWVFIGGTDVEAETPKLWPPDVES